MTRTAIASLTVFATAAVSQAAPVIDGTLSAADGYGAPVKVFTDNYVNGTDATGGTNAVSTYFASDANYVYGVIHLDSGPKAFDGSNVYFYSSGASTNTVTGLPGVYGDNNDIILEGANGWGYATPSGISGGVHYAYDPSTVNYVYNGSDTVEFSIARSLLGSYDKYRYGGQLFAYEFHTGGDRVDGALVSPVPEPASLAVAGLGAAALLMRRRRVTA